MKKTKRGDAGDHGREFQFNLLTVFLLNAFRGKLQDWKLSPENENAGKFDDVVLEFSEGAVLLQAKHKESNKKITMEDLMSVNSKNNEFSLPKYFLDYQKIKNNFSIKNVIICTNVGIVDKVSTYLDIQSVCPESILYYEDKRYTFYIFKENILFDLKENVKKYVQKNPRNIDMDEAEISDENLQDFLKHLHFYPSYPSGHDLRDVIEKILTHLDLRYRISYSEINAKIMDWFQRIGRRKESYLNETYAKAIFSEIWRDKHWESLEKYNIHFARNDFNFGQHTKQTLHVTVKEQYLLQEIKIFRALQNDKNKILFLNTDDDTEIREQALEAFTLPSYTLLIIVCVTFLEESVINEIHYRLRIILDKYKYKKILLVAESDDKLWKRIQCGSDNHDVIDGTVSFKDFIKKTQRKILKNRNIEFQGKFISLEELLETQETDKFEEILHPEVLEKLIKNENVRVGRAVPNVSRFYVSRTLLRKLNKNRAETHQISEENVCEVVTDKMTLITDSAGMGKSTVLVKLAEVIKQQNPHLWVIIIELNHHTAYLRELLKNEKNITEILTSMKFTNRLEQLVFQLRGKIVLMVDGVDEISPDYTDLVVDLLVRCRNMPNFARVFVTSRPHMTELLETKLQVKSLTLQGFTKQNQIDFLTDFWTFNLKLDEQDREQCEQYAKALISKLDKNALFTAIPLQVRMMAEIFERTNPLEDWVGCKEYLSEPKAELNLHQSLNITKLYELFIGKKRDLFVEKGNPTGNPAANRSLADQFNESLVYHRALALKEIIDNFKSELFTAYREVEENVEEIMLKIGLVQKVGGGLHFLHRTFAEYFVAESILLELQNQNQNVEFQRFFIDHVLLDSEFDIVRGFLNYFLQNLSRSLSPDILQKYKSHTFNNHYFKFNNLYLIHRLAENGLTDILKLLLKCIDFQIVRNRKIDIMDLYRDETDEGFLVQTFGNTLRGLKYLLSRGGVNIIDDNGDTPLYHAVKSGHFEMVKFLLEQGGNIDNEETDEIKIWMDVIDISILWGAEHIATYFFDRILEREDVTGREPMLAYAAVCLGRLDVIKDFVQRGLDVNSKAEGGELLIFTAIQREQLEIIEYLIQQGAEINNQTWDKSYLGWAVYFKYFEVVKLLTKYKEDIGDWMKGLQISIEEKHEEIANFMLDRILDKKVGTGNEPMLAYAAAYLGRLHVLKDFLDQGLDVNSKVENGEPLIFGATKGQRLEIIKYLVQQGVDVNSRDDSYNTPVHLVSSKSSFIPTAKLLLALGIDVNRRNDYGETALHIAVTGNNFDMVKLLVENGTNINCKNKLGMTPLSLAATGDNLHLVKFLTENGGDVNTITDEDDSVSHWVVHLGNLEMMKFLISHKVDVNIKNNEDQTALSFAIRWGDVHMVDLLVQHGADLNAKDLEGQTALHFAADSSSNMIKLLVSLGLDVDAKDNIGYTPLHVACSRGKRDCVETLLESNAEIDVLDNEGRTPLFLCFEELVAKFYEDDSDVSTRNYYYRRFINQLDIASQLVKQYGANVNARDRKNRTVLHVVVSTDILFLVQFFVELNADVNASDGEGHTPLHLAAEKGAERVAKFLVRRGTDVDIKDCNGDTAADLARKNGHLSLLEHLENRRRKTEKTFLI